MVGRQRGETRAFKTEARFPFCFILWFDRRSKMDMKARKDLEMGRPIIRQIPPIAAALSDSLLSRRCAACFSPISCPLHERCTCKGECRSSVFYCSPNCADEDLQLHIQSGECRLMALARDLIPNVWQGKKSFPAFGGTCDLRAALRLLFHHQQSGSIPHLQWLRANPRVGDLMSNREKLLYSGHQSDTEIANLEAMCHDDAIEMAQQIKEGASLMLMARQFAGFCSEISTEDYGQRLEEEALCQVITNGVQVQVDEQTPNYSFRSGLFPGELQCNVLGTAVYGPSFSWCNHSCRPNACYRFELVRGVSDVKEFNLETQLDVGPEDGIYIEPGTEDSSLFSPSNMACQRKKSMRNKAYGPRVALRTIRRVSKGEEIFITYTDLIQPTEIRQVELWFKYRFVCHCERCDVTPSTFIDHILQETNCTNMASLSSSSNLNDFTEIEVLTDKIKSGISEFILNGEPGTCCKDIENALEEIIALKGSVKSEIQLQISQYFFKIHPLHRLCLDAYTALASAYRVCAADMLYCSVNKSQPDSSCFALSTPELSATRYIGNADSILRDCNSNDECCCPFSGSFDGRQCINFTYQLSNLSGLTAPADSQSVDKHKCDNCSFMSAVESSGLSKSVEFNRAAAAYTVLLAGAVQHFFHAGEWGLVITAARFWLNAAEALLRWIMKCECALQTPKMQQFSFKNWIHSKLGSMARCINCECLLQIEHIGGATVPLYSGSESRYRNKEGPFDASKILSCMNKFIEFAWPSLQFGHSFLEAIQNPLDYC